MKVSELMDNDLLMYGGHICRFVIRSMDAVIQRVSDDGDYPPCACAAADPIPLTAEILKANGFMVRGDEYYRSLNQRSCVGIRFYDHAVIDIEYNYSYHMDRVHLNADYVHELQHALRLCGISELADSIKV